MTVGMLSYLQHEMEIKNISLTQVIYYMCLLAADYVEGKKTAKPSENNAEETDADLIYGKF